MAKKNYQELSEKIIELIGTKDNVIRAYHCVTRLRFNVKDKDLVDLDGLKNLKGAIGAQWSGDQLQIIIGQEVADVYSDLCRIGGFNEEKSVDENLDEEASKGIIDKLTGAIIAIMSPYIPVLAASGLISGFLTILTNTGILDTASNTYIVFNAAANAIYYFFPVALAFTACKKFGANPYVGFAIAATLVHPDFQAISVTGSTMRFMGLEIAGQTFSNTVFQIVIVMWAYSYLEKFLNRVLPKSIQFMLVPTLCIVIMVPLSILVIGPIGFAISNGIAAVYSFLIDRALVVTDILLGGFTLYLILFGVHWALLPILIATIVANGRDYGFPGMAIANFAVLGTTLGIFLTTKDNEQKSIAGVATFTNFLGGVTEPGIYGVLIKNKKYMLATTIGGMVGGLIVGLGKCYVEGFSFTGIFGLPVFMTPATAPIFFAGVIATIVVSCLVAMYFQKQENAKAAE